MAIIEHNGYYIDDETGEVHGIMGHDKLGTDCFSEAVGQTDDQIVYQERFEVNSREAAEWVLDKMADADAAAIAIKARKAAFLENIDKQMNAVVNRHRYLVGRFQPDLQAWAERELAITKRKSITLDNGTLKFSACGGGIKVLDEEAALEWARDFAATAIKKTETVLVSLLPEGVDLPVTLFERVPKGANFKITTGVKKG